MIYYAHSKEGEPKSKWQTVREHSENVASTVADFSSEWCERWFGENLGLLHDIGKYQKDFQNKICNGEKIFVDHSICGAREAYNYGIGQVGEYCIAGHHSGLPDYGTNVDVDEGTLTARKKKQTQDYSAFKSDLNPPSRPFGGLKVGLRDAKEAAFFIRMMYSCLVDADFLDTESFCKGAVERGVYLDFSKCKEQLGRKIGSFLADTPVKIARNRLLTQVLSHSDESADIYYMNMPTGSGKTFASMSFALERAMKAHKKRIIYIIPYTSIIEQNAQEFKSVFGENILEHHCNFDFDGIENQSTQDKLKHTSENWDASLVVTTNVQFFKSIYGNRSSQLRKLHNIADSVLVFDEVHMFPTRYYQPCLEAIKNLVRSYGCEALFLTATMPDFDVWLDKFECSGLKTLDLLQDKSDFSAFSRCKIENLGALTLESLVLKAEERVSTLIVVNSKKAAKAVYEKLVGNKYHLSTSMTGNDRAAAVKRIRAALRAEEKITVVSTSLIEAGVDLDFEQVFRETAGLDNLLQTAGRCNREGKRKGCMTYAFTFEESELQPKNDELKCKAYFAKRIFEKYNDVESADAIKDYFDMIYSYAMISMKTMDFSKAIAKSAQLKINFKTYAENFNMIDDSTVGVVIPQDNEVRGLLSAAENGAVVSKRKLQRYTVNLYPKQFETLLKMGVIASAGDIFYLSNIDYYRTETGIEADGSIDYLID